MSTDRLRWVVHRAEERLFEPMAVDILARAVAGPLPDPMSKTADGVEIDPLAATDQRVDVLPASRQAHARAALLGGDAGYLAIDHWIPSEAGPVGWLWWTTRDHRDTWGGLHISLAEREAYLYDLWVDPRYRSTGAGLRLLTTAIREMQGRGVEVVYAAVDRTNQSSQVLCRLMLGFRSVQRVARIRVLDRWAWQIPGSARPRQGPAAVAPLSDLKLGFGRTKSGV
jgi:ribosomal protein S18 acetylase RimI-like enzyme